MLKEADPLIDLIRRLVAEAAAERGCAVGAALPPVLDRKSVV